MNQIESNQTRILQLLNESEQLSSFISESTFKKCKLIENAQPLMNDLDKNLIECQDHLKQICIKLKNRNFLIKLDDYPHLKKLMESF